ncbi:MAG: alpha/beta fold hydrolase [Cyanobacteria bacterium P01_D01_bin.73]
MAAAIASDRPSNAQSYTWEGFQCSYEIVESPSESSQDANSPVLLLIHPIGVGLSRTFWDRFLAAWQTEGTPLTVYNPDLLGCGDSDIPDRLTLTEEWAAQLWQLIETKIQRPVVLVVQGALLPVGLELWTIADTQGKGDRIKAMVLSGPPAWRVMTTIVSDRQKRWLWNGFFHSFIGALFFRYARTEKFLRNFSAKQLFANAEDVDREWLDMTRAGSRDMETRHAVFSFLARYWQKGYGDRMKQCPIPVLSLFGDAASSISNNGKGESPEDRVKTYADVFPQGRSQSLPGRNVLPYESTTEFTNALLQFLRDQDIVSSQPKNA